MHREYVGWYSPHLGRSMEMLVFGHAGARVLMFPTSMGKFFECEDQGLIGALAEHVNNGWLQIFCVDSVDKESWYADWKHPGARAYRHVQYDRYLVDEVMPFTRYRNANPFAISVGASFGAYHALNFALKHPDCIGRAIGMSGLYDIRSFADGHYDNNVYFNNPVDYIPNEHDAWRLNALRHMDIVLAVGRDDRLKNSSERLSAALWGKGIGNALRLWDGWSHDWPYWKQMIRLYIGGHD